MLTKIMKWSSVTILLPALFWEASEGYLVALQMVVTAGAVLVAWEGYLSEKQVWAIGFLAIAALFNPFQPLLFAGGTSIWLNLISIATFLVSLVALKTTPRHAMPSIAT